MAEGERHITIPMLSFDGTGTQKVNLSIRNLMAAAHFARKSGLIEQKHKGESLGPFFDEESYYVISSVVMSVSSVEARINEYIEDYRNTIPGLNNAYKERGMLNKCQKALSISGKAEFDENSDPYSSVSILTKFRNAYVHFKPEWENSQVKHKEISEMIKSRFALNPFFTEDTPLFPLRALGYGCSQWGVRVSKEFMDEFDLKAGHPKITEKFLTYLNTDIQ